MKIKVELDSQELKNLIVQHIRNTLNDTSINERDITFEVKTKQNYKAEWELGDFRATIDKNIRPV